MKEHEKCILRRGCALILSDLNLTIQQTLVKQRTTQIFLQTRTTLNFYTLSHLWGRTAMILNFHYMTIMG